MTIHELAQLILREKHWEHDEGESWVDFTVMTEGDRSHRVRLTEFRHENIAFVRFTSVIGSAEVIDPRRTLSALGLNAHLVFGAIAIVQNELVLTESLPLGMIEPRAAMLTISYLAQQADRYESVMFGDDTQ
ncbi:MAG: hypothetical protein HYU52_06945 [Acidobacteria bacterium]|nr:hypothetical protein [Acidobacteriota bacterium]